jgi:hypothetical protein
VARQTDAANITASQAATVRPIKLVELLFSSGPVRAVDTPFDVTVQVSGESPNETFLGVGQLGSVGAVEETSELKAHSMAFTLRGIPNDLISISLAENYQGRSAKLWVGFLDAEHAVIGEPTLEFSGLMDTMDTDIGTGDNGATSTVNVTAQSRLVRWDEPSGARYTNEEQVDLFPGDRGLEFVAQMVEKELVWGA